MPSVAQIDGLNIPGGAPAISAPAAAYSVRLLDSALGVPTYTGAAMRVRRVTGAGQAGNDDEADVGFDSNDVISLESPVSNFSTGGSNATTLGQFLNVGTVNGITYTDADTLAPNTAAAYVDGWKDQSGNGNDAEQTAPDSQPQIHDGTADTDLITENGKPTIDFDGTTYLGNTDTISAASDYTIYFVENRTQSQGYSFDSETGRLVLGNNQGAYYAFNAFRGNGLTQGAQYLNGYYLLNSGAFIVENGTVTQTGLTYTQVAISSSNTIYVNALNFTSRFATGNVQEILIWNSDQDDAGNRTDIEDNINSEYLIYQPTDQPTSGLLYDYGSATGGTDAAAAYSVRQLSDKAVLCMRIRRDMGAGNPGDDDEINIGFDANGDLDTAAISAFCGTGTGFVTRWWDQSVNGNHADQPVGGTGSNTSQPQIYNGTAVITENGKPAIYFDGIDDSIELTSGLTPANAVCQVLVTVFDNSVNGNRMPLGSNVSSYYWQHRGTDQIRVSTTGGDVSYNTGLAAGSQYLGIANGTGSEYTLRVNGTLGVTSTNSGNWSFQNIGRGFSGNTYAWDNVIQEVIFWPADQDTAGNITGIETNIDTYYQIP